MLLSAVSVLVVVQSSSEIPEGLMNNPVRPVHNTTLESGNDCYHSGQNLSSSSLIFKLIKIKIFSIIIFHLVLCGCETWSLILREENSLRVFQNRV